MSHRTPSTKVLLQPIQNSLAQRHHDSREAYHGRGRPLSDVREVDVGEVHERFDDVEEGLGVGEAVAFFEGLDAVDLIEI